MSIKLKAKGNYRKAHTYLEKLLEVAHLGQLDKFGRMGVEALSAATPKESGMTSESWMYQIERTKGTAKIIWTNSNVNEGVNIALILQYGHGTGTGGYVEGRDYINPAIQPVFDRIAEEASEEVRSIG